MTNETDHLGLDHIFKHIACTFEKNLSSRASQKVGNPQATKEYKVIERVFEDFLRNSRCFASLRFISCVLGANYVPRKSYESCLVLCLSYAAGARK